jgi:hypothetical protein
MGEMKAIFGVIALLFVLAIVGSLARRQLQVAGERASVRSTAVAPSVPSFAPDPGAATVPEQSKSMQQRARSETARALEQGAQRNQRAEP